MACAELFIAKELFNHPLAVVETTLNGNRMNIFAQGCHLALLERANLALGEENCNVHTLNSPEALGNCAARISGGCHKYIYPLLFICKPSQHLAHKAGANILEGKSWPVKKFQRVERRLCAYALERYRKIEGGSADLQKLALRELVKEERGQIGCHLREGATGEFLYPLHIHLRYSLRHKESAIRSKSHYCSLLKREEPGCRILLPCTVKSHILEQNRLLLIRKLHERPDYLPWRGRYPPLFQTVGNAQP